MFDVFCVQSDFFFSGQNILRYFSDDQTKRNTFLKLDIK